MDSTPEQKARILAARMAEEREREAAESLRSENLNRFGNRQQRRAANRSRRKAGLPEIEVRRPASAGTVTIPIDGGFRVKVKAAVFTPPAAKVIPFRRSEA